MALAQTNCGLPLRLVARGKVRDIYSIDGDEEGLLFVATDRISAYDVIMENGIRNKGKILTGVSKFWFDFLSDVCPNHLITTNLDEMPKAVMAYKDQLEGRTMYVRKLTILPIEAIVRGYLSGSAWKEYRKSGTIHGIKLPPGLQESAELPEPIFTPSTKAEQGEHDENIHPDKAKELIGEKNAKQVEQLALSLYTKARAYARAKGIIIADTKFEFGLNANGDVVLADEVLTPDSSRFWPAESYSVGAAQQSFDKQFLRDWLVSQKLDGKPGVSIPEHVERGTSARYQEVYEIITGNKFIA